MTHQTARSPDRHARSELGMQVSRDGCSLAPRNGFYPATDRCSRTHPLPLPARSLRLGTAFCSPAAIALFSRASAARSALPTYPFGDLLNDSRSPFGLQLPSSAAFFTPPGYVHRSKPVAVFLAQNSQTSIRLSLPFRTFIPPDRSAQPVSGLRSLPFCTARFPFAPRER